MFDFCRIRLIFSIADIQTPEESEFPEEEGEGEEGASSEDALGTSYPLRCSFSISKVSCYRIVHPTSSLLTAILFPFPAMFL